MPRVTIPLANQPAPVRERLLREATRQFARTGFRGTTVDGIVTAAKVNKRMVYHYFGNKEKLYHAVLTAAYRGLETVEVEALSHTQDIGTLTEEIVRSYFAFLAAHPEFVRLLLWENLNDGQGLAQTDSKLSKDPVLTALNRLLRDGIAAGRIRPDMDARHLLISIIGLCLIYSSNRYTLSQALRMDLGSARVRAQGIRHVTRLLLDGIKIRD
ncbi:MAG: TetR/AcrR family transcriptional regulator [Cephaloticoccus sp.]|nr:TetR/AcrR family transcriptional regulator [Cephaloticoccus sp.]MCF7761593.1 TetR/AcrR family transcriptional regulator [Cephaloticoccus sp.]